MKSTQPKRSFDPVAISRIAAILATSDQAAEIYCIRLCELTENPDLPTRIIEWAVKMYPQLRSNPQELVKRIPKTTFYGPPTARSLRNQTKSKPQPKSKHKLSRKKRVPQKTGSAPKGSYSYDFYFDAPPDPDELPSKHTVSGGLPGSGKRS